MTQQNPGRDDDWGSTTNWQQPPPPQQAMPGPAYGFTPGFGSSPHPGYQPAPPPQPGAPWPGAGSVRPLQTYLVPAILVTLFCFLPTGVAAIYFASQVSNKQAVGDFHGAAEASRKAKLWVIVSACVGVLLGVIIVASVASNSSSSYS